MNRRIALSLSLCGVLWAGAAHADPKPGSAAPRTVHSAAAQAARADIQAVFGFVPAFMNSVPDLALPGAWEEMKGLQMNPNTVLPPKVKELIGLAVAAQVPCKYCVYAHTKFATLGGASEDEIGEAVTIAALTRHWSTVLQGGQAELGDFKAEIAKLVAHLKKGPPAPAAPVNVVDAASARKEIGQNFGSVPTFLRKFSDAALPGAWKEMRDVEMNPSSALSGKHKSLIGIAVASQIPCRYCLAADTEFAKLDGATEQEIGEAIAMAALTRHWSTLLNGLQADETEFKRDIDRVLKNAQKHAAKPQARNEAPAQPVLAVKSQRSTAGDAAQADVARP